MPCPARETSSRLDQVIAARTAARRRVAETAAARALSELQTRGIDIRVFGSLARDDFMAHSDVDFIVHTPVAGSVRVDVETGVARAMEGTGIPYHIVYVSDLTPEQAAAFASG